MASPRGTGYDVVVVGARCAGAATAMLLARAGARVLLLDRGRPGTETLSTHALMRPAVVQLHRWGLLEQVIAAGTPALRETVVHYGDEAVAIPVKPGAGVDALYAPRRSLLDGLLVQAAAQAGADVRHGHTVMALRRDPRGRVGGVVVRGPDGEVGEVAARLTVGADGRGSRVAAAVAAPTTWSGRRRGGTAFAYWHDLPAEGYHWHYGRGLAAGLIPTGGGQSAVFVSTSGARFREAMTDGVAAGFDRLLGEAAPSLAARVRTARRAGGFRVFGGLDGWLRRPWGDGWALVGDAGYFKDPISAHGISDALRDAELLADAVVGAAPGALPAALAHYEQVRDELSRPLAVATDEVAGYDWDLDRLRDLLLDVSAAMKTEVAALAGRAERPAA